MTPGSPTPPSRDPLHPLLAAMFDRELTDAEAAELRALLAEDDDAMRRYIDLTTAHALLGWEHAEGAQGAGDRGHETSASASLSLWERSSFTSVSAVAIAAAILIAAAAAAIYVFAINPQSEIRNLKSNPPIATLIDVTGGAALMIDDDLANPGGEYGAGMCAIESGSASLQLTSGASVRLGGRARMTMHDAMHATLVVGRFGFHCPPSAVGFTVDLPDGTRVVDLGTAFTIHVDEHGHAWTEVTEGAVRIDIDDWSYMVSAGEAVRIVDGGIDPLPSSPSERLAMRLRDDPATMSYSPMDNIGNDAGRFEGDRSYRPGDGVFRLPESEATASLTLAAWVNVEQAHRLRALIVTETGHIGRVHWQLQPDGSMSLGTIRSAGPTAYRSTKRLADAHLNRWVHLAVVADGVSRRVRFFIDGEPAGEKRIEADDAFDVSRAAIGDSEMWPGRALPGRIDDLIVLSRAMDEYEINEIVQAGRLPQQQKEQKP